MIVLTMYTLIFFHPGRLLGNNDADSNISDGYKPTYSQSESLPMAPV